MTQPKNQSDSPNPKTHIPDFENFGMDYVGYITHIKNSDHDFYEVRAANGTRLSSTLTLAEAVLLMDDFKLKPVVLH